MIGKVPSKIVVPEGIKCERLKIFDSDQVQWIVSKLDKTPKHRFLPLEMNYLGVETKYLTYPSANLVDSLSNFINEHAPKFEGEYLFYRVFNILEPGQGIPLHFDVDPYVRNCVVALQDSDEDGITINEELFCDRAGWASCMVGGNLLPHEVKPVKKKRYTLILTYRKIGT